MALCINQSGTYRNITTLCINQSGTYRNITTGCINQAGTYRKFGFGLAQPGALGSSFGGGFLICCQGGGLAWIVAPSSSEVSRTWYCTNDANTKAQQVSGCTGWFVPSLLQLRNPGYCCRSFWDSHTTGFYEIYWSSTESPPGSQPSYVGAGVCWGLGNSAGEGKQGTFCVRAFRCVTY